MKICVLQHATFEGPGMIAEWARERGHAVEVREIFRGAALPGLADFDLLVVMGGEMNIYQYRDWPWLKAEAEFIRAALAVGKRVVGICLGAQLIADALGARVVQNPVVELGWWPVSWTPEANAENLGPLEPVTVLHWHGDTFSLPEGAIRLASSEACAEQGFFIPGKCLALQFHLEVDAALARGYVEGQGVWPSGPFVQSGKQVAEEAEKFCGETRKVLLELLDGFVA